jgi:hypothetical protein
MAKVNSVISNNPLPTENGSIFHVTKPEVSAVKSHYITSNLTISPEEFAAIFGRGVKWALERMRDGSVVVLDEYAKRDDGGVRFSKSARVCAASVQEYRQSLQVG